MPLATRALRQKGHGSGCQTPQLSCASMSLLPLDAREQVLLRQTLGLRCRKAREELGLSQRALAAAMERSPSWVREVEAGDQYAPAYLIRALATAIDRSPAWFYGDEAPDAEQLALRVLAVVAQGARDSEADGRGRRASVSHICY